MRISLFTVFSICSLALNAYSIPPFASKIAVSPSVRRVSVVWRRRATLLVNNRRISRISISGFSPVETDRKSQIRRALPFREKQILASKASEILTKKAKISVISSIEKPKPISNSFAENEKSNIRSLSPNESVEKNPKAISRKSLSNQITEIKNRFAELARSMSAFPSGPKGKFIISGNMGSGKSTLSRLLAARIPGSLVIPEPSEVPSLPAYCKEMDERPNQPNRYGYAVQMEFLEVRMKGEVEARENDHRVVLMDRCIHDGRHVYAAAMLESGIFEQKEFDRFAAEYERAAATVDAPLAFVYLRTSTPVLLQRIVARGNVFEMKTPPAYLDQLSRKYEEFFANIDAYIPGAKVIVIDTDSLSAAEVAKTVWKQISPLIK